MQHVTSVLHPAALLALQVTDPVMLRGRCFVFVVLCGLQVTELYSSSSWQHINEHLHEVLGRQCAELADGPGVID